MAQQSSGEFASADPTKGEEDARVQERGIRAKISLSACSNTKYFQRPTSSYLGKNAPGLQGDGDEHVASSRRSRLKITARSGFSRSSFDNVTAPSGRRSADLIKARGNCCIQGRIDSCNRHFAKSTDKPLALRRPSIDRARSPAG